MKRYLLDTNILSDLLRNPQGSITRRIGEVGEDRVCTSVIVAAELRYGARKKGSARLTAQVEAVLAAVDVLALEPLADAAYAELRCSLEAAGTPAGGNDLLIAAQAIALDYILVTDNTSEFARIGGLRWENWLRP